MINGIKSMTNVTTEPNMSAGGQLARQPRRLSPWLRRTAMQLHTQSA